MASGSVWESLELPHACLKCPAYCRPTGANRRTTRRNAASEPRQPSAEELRCLRQWESSSVNADGETEKIIFVTNRNAWLKVYRAADRPVHLLEAVAGKGFRALVDSDANPR